MTHLTTGMLLAILLLISMAVPAFAAQTTISVSIVPGPLTATIDPDVLLPEIVYSDEIQQSSSPVLLGVDDLRGSGAGWHVTLQATDLVYSGPAGHSVIPAENLAISASGNPVMLAGQAVNATHGPFSTSTGGSLDQPRSVLVADPGFGQGAYSQSLSLDLRIPARSQTGTYSGALIVSIASGP